MTYCVGMCLAEGCVLLSDTRTNAGWDNIATFSKMHVFNAPGERVVLYLDNCPDLLVAMFGAYRAGSTVLPSNARLTEQELAFLVTDGEAKVIVTDLAHAETARRAAGDARVVVAGDELDLDAGVLLLEALDEMVDHRGRVRRVEHERPGGGLRRGAGRQQGERDGDGRGERHATGHGHGGRTPLMVLRTQHAVFARA